MQNRQYHDIPKLSTCNDKLESLVFQLNLFLVELSIIPLNESRYQSDESLIVQNDFSLHVDGGGWFHEV